MRKCIENTTPRNTIKSLQSKVPSDVLMDGVQVTEQLAEGVQKIATAMQEIKKTRLSERAILVLLQDATGLTRRDIKLVLESLETLDALFLKPKTKKQG